MIDPLQLPILLKAIDFIFDEGHKILQERRDRRRLSRDSSEEQQVEPQKEIILPEPEKVMEIKQDLHNSKLDEHLWLDHESEVEHLVRLLETYSRNHHLAKEQYAKWGSALVPPIVMHNLSEAENAMLETLQKLESVLFRVYKKDIQPNQ